MIYFQIDEGEEMEVESDDEEEETEIEKNVGKKQAEIELQVRNLLSRIPYR